MVKKNPLILLSFFISFSVSLGGIFAVDQQNSTTNPVQVKVGVVLSLETRTGTMGWNCIEMALSDFYASHSHYKTRIVPTFRDSKNDVVGAAAAALDLIKNVQVEAIIGPESSMQADFVIDLGSKAQVPIISFSATSPSPTSLRSLYFLRAAQNDSSQVKAISSIVKAFGWREVVPIYVDNEFGEGIIPYLTDAMEDVNTLVSYRSLIPPSASDDQIGKELSNLMKKRTRVFIVHMYPDLASKLFTKAKEIGMMEKGYAWIITNSIGDYISSLNTSALNAMQGVIGIKTYVQESARFHKLTAQWSKSWNRKQTNFDTPELDIVGLLAYDAAWALALAVEQAGETNLGYHTNAKSSTNLTDLETFGVSKNGGKLRDALLKTTFEGLAGKFVLVNRQLKSTNFRILNVIGDQKAKWIGFWTPEAGLSKVLDIKSSSTHYSASNASLGAITWPGDTTGIPKGWEFPINGKALRIGVPVKEGFREFVSVTHDNNTNTTTVNGGYCIDVFEAALKALPYNVTYEYIPFAKPNGEMNGTYDDMVCQVYLGNFDAVVGDVAIIASRSLFIDYTLPYTESGVSMVVPIKGASRKKALAFLKPLTWDLWLTSACFFVFIGVIVWFLEHRVNEEFRKGPLLHQIATSQWFSFSTMFFAQREKVSSNLARIVVIVWCFVVLILIQSYTASLTSLLTIEQLRPSVADVNELLKSGAKVGYPKGSFVYNMLKSLKFDESNLVSYTSSNEMHELFQKGSGNGAIAAAYDEIPFIKVFLSNRCSEYTMQDPTYRTDGLGFVFPIGSPLVSDISRAILKVTEGEEMERINRHWFGNQSNCSSSSIGVTSTSLSLDSFWGLFGIAGGTAIVALLIFLCVFVRKEKNTIERDVVSKKKIQDKIIELLKLYDKKDETFHTRTEAGARVSDQKSSNSDVASIPPVVVEPSAEVVEFSGPVTWPNNWTTDSDDLMSMDSNVVDRSPVNEIEAVQERNQT